MLPYYFHFVNSPTGEISQIVPGKSGMGYLLSATSLSELVQDRGD
jgi:hypothetical protein